MEAEKSHRRLETIKCQQQLSVGLSEAFSSLEGKGEIRWCHLTWFAISKAGKKETKGIKKMDLAILAKLKSKFYPTTSKKKYLLHKSIFCPDCWQTQI